MAIEARKRNKYGGFLVTGDGTADVFDPTQPLDHWITSELTSVCEDIDLSHVPFNGAKDLFDTFH